jgi:RNA polymerase sigma-70 factor (ECF subfamily)
MSESSTTQVLQHWLDRLRGGDETARQPLVQRSCERLERLTRKMLQGFPGVKRWEQTADVLQNALLRLCRALQEVSPPTVRDYFRLAAVQVRRELLDLRRHYFGPHGAGAHEVAPQVGNGGAATPEPSDSRADPVRLLDWTDFHEQIEALPDEDRELFDLLWYQGLSQAEAGAVLNVSERTLKRRWQAARLRLHAALRGEMPEP